MERYHISIIFFIVLCGIDCAITPMQTLLQSKDNKKDRELLTQKENTDNIVLRNILADESISNIVLDYLQAPMANSSYQKINAHSGNMFGEKNKKISALYALSNGNFVSANRKILVWNAHNIKQKPLEAFKSENRVSALLELPADKLAISFNNGMPTEKKVPGITIIDLKNIKNKHVVLHDECSFKEKIVCPVEHMARLSDQNIIAASVGGITLWDLKTYKSKRLIAFANPTRIANVTVLPEGTIAYVIDQIIYIMDHQKNTLAILPEKTGYSNGLSMLGNGVLLSTSDSWITAQERFITFHSFDSKTNVQKAVTLADVQSNWPHGPGADIVIGLANNYLLATRNNQLKIWDLKSPDEQPIVWSHPMCNELDRIAQVVVLKDGRVVSASDNGIIAVWDTSLAAIIAMSMRQKIVNNKKQNCIVQ